MKKYLSAFCVLALVVGCSKENIAPVQSSNEVLLTSYAGQPLTKTTIAGNKTDGFTANWAGCRRRSSTTEFVRPSTGI